MIENAPRGCALRAEEDGCCRSRAPARESGLPDSLFFHGKVRPMEQKPFGQAAQYAQRKMAADAAALRFLWVMSIIQRISGDIMNDMKKSKKKSTIFRIFLVPLIAIMLVQSGITIGTLIFRRTTEMLEKYSSSMMSRLVENRRVILQNDMNQRWSSIREKGVQMNLLLDQFLGEEGISLKELSESDERKARLLDRMFPESLEILQNNSVTGIFLILTGENMETDREFDGFFIRDSDPNKNPANYTDLLLERGDKQLSRNWDIPLDTNWTTRFSMDGPGQNPADSYFYEPWRAGEAYEDADPEDLGYWALPFCLEKKTEDAYEMITYSLPLRYEGRVYAIWGVEISGRSLNGYFPVAELNDSQQSGYMLAVKKEEHSYSPLVGKGVLYNLVRSMGDRFVLKETQYDNLSLVEEAQLSGQGIYAVACPLNLYSNNVPYQDTEWVLLGLDTEEDLFGISRRLYLWIVISIMIGLIFGVIGIYFVVRYLTRPVQRLMECIRGGRAGLLQFKPSNILEIDALYQVVTNLTERQKEAENILLEEKERYKVALESSEDIFFSYDLRTQMLDLVNHKTMSGQWSCVETGNGFINPDYIYEADREEALRALQPDQDNLYAEFRMRWPEETEYVWVVLTGKMVCDTDGRRWKLVGSIRNIQEQKEREARNLRRNITDGVTGLYVYGAGIEKITESRRREPDGVMLTLFMDGLREASEKNGIVYEDMILEEIGLLMQKQCGKWVQKTGNKAVALRLNQEEFVLWLEKASQSQGAKFARGLLKKAGTAFDEEIFHVRMYAGLSCGRKKYSSEQLIRMAKLARKEEMSHEGETAPFYEDTVEKSQKILPALQEQEINSPGYDENTSLVSAALNLFGRGEHFPAQMLLMIRKIGRFYQASDVLVSLLQADYNSNYLNYQWHREEQADKEIVRKYKEEEKSAFYAWQDQKGVCRISEKDSEDQVLQCFLGIEAGQKGVALLLYDGGSYVGNLCILGICPEILDNPEEYQSLAELARAIQSQLNQRQHDIASKAKSEFLSRMSHEIRTPMNGIIGMTAIALQQEQSQERIMDCLQKIRSSSDYLLGLINDILDMSKIESGKMKLEPVNFNMHEMLGTIQELIRAQTTAKEIDFVQRITLSDSWYEADKIRISQVIINLLGNAVKFTPRKGRITLTVKETSVCAGKAMIYFAVSDTGVGIAKEDQDRVFRSFEQAAGANSATQKGTGLGLSISSRLVQLMGSNIQLESAPGKGSTFSFTIPLAVGEDQEEQTEEEKISFEGCRVLVVEDNELNSEIAQCLLEERGFEVDCVYDGAQAIERIRTTEPGTYDVILMDIMMPVMDGLEAARTIRSMEREDCHTIPIIAMSANAFDDDLKKSVECGMNGHLSKPVEVEKLYRTLDKVIRSSE